MTVSDAAGALQALAHEYWEGTLRRNPILATFYGDYRYNSKLPDLSASGRAAEQAELRQVVERLNGIAVDALETEDRITHDMLGLAARAGLDGLRLRLDEMAVDQMEGPQVWLQEIPNFHPTDTPDHVEELNSRYASFGALVDDYLEALRDGMRDGRTAPAIAVARVRAQLDALLATPAERSAMVAPLAGKSLATEVERTVQNVVILLFLGCASSCRTTRLARNPASGR